MKTATSCLGEVGQGAGVTFWFSVMLEVGSEKKL